MVEQQQAELSVNEQLLYLEPKALVDRINTKRQSMPVLLYTTAAKLKTYTGLAEPRLVF